ncbi:stage II sporulation protein M [Candidatus Woesearchaeota archaeon]|nr:stage II sporulation protein M [Candidatus Woesearchaeota archaeon]MBT5740441.1 stage II sporulation protein M [Candidatus Woesearchaeota archaeon]
MALELIINPFVVKKKPWQMFVAGFIYALIALLLSYLVFQEIAGILMVFLIVIATLPMIYTAIKEEEALELQIKRESKLLKEHAKVLVYLMFLFFGITTALVLAYILLPQSMTDIIFSLQQSAIGNVNSAVQGNVTQFGFFSNIFFNNLKVLFFCLVFSFVYGTGAIFILTWNASVIAVAMGGFIRSQISNAGTVIGNPSLATYFSAATFGLFRYMTHGFFEILAYFVAGLAGGIISIALIKHNLKERRILVDSLNLIFISLGLLLFAAIIEVFITPLLFPI